MIHLRKYRRKAKLTQAELAELIGTTEAMIAHYEQDRKRPGPARRRALEKALGLREGVLG